MLTLHTCSAERDAPAADLSATSLPPGVVWIDLLNADAAERAFVERVTGLPVPTLDRLSEIESSSRLSSAQNALFTSMPIIYRAEGDEPLSTSLGFVLRADLLITVRFEELTPFTNFKNQIAAKKEIHVSSAGAFVGLSEAIVDRMADILEHIGAELDQVSHRIFRAEVAKTERPNRPARASADLREVLRRIGQSGDLVSKIRDTLLGVGRIVPYVASLSAAWLPPELAPRLTTLRHDIASLNDYDAFLTNKVQLMLDATLGLINIEQNNIIKVLTVVSVVGVPPTLIASMYGMNFKNMPELDWAWGYPYVLALIAISAISPLLWFKWRGWL